MKVSEQSESFEGYMCLRSSAEMHALERMSV